MKTNAAGVALIKQFERLELTGYLCPAGVPTAGWGHTGPDVEVGRSYSQVRADTWLIDDLAGAEWEVTRRLKLAATPNQFSAMVSLCFNIGAGGFAKSSVLKFHNAGAHAKAGECFLLWNKATGADGVKRELKGLTRRRAAEAMLYMTPDAAEEAADPQRTRAADVEPTPAQPPVVSNATITTGAIGGAGSLIGIQAVSQVSTIWSWLTENGIEPKVVLAVLGLALVGVGIGLAWKLIQSRQARG